MSWLIHSYITNEALKKQADEIRSQVQYLEKQQLKREQSNIKKFIRMEKPPNAKILYESDAYTKLFVPGNPAFVIASTLIGVLLFSVVNYYSDMTGAVVVSITFMAFILWLTLTPRVIPYQITNRGIYLFGTFYCWEAISQIRHKTIWGQLDNIEITLMSHLGSVNLLIDDAETLKVKKILDSYI